MIRVFATFLCAIALFASPASAKLKVVASFSILGDMVSEIAGAHAEVTTLVGADGDAHTFEPSPADARTIADADLIVINGLGLEPWIAPLARSAGYKNALIETSRGVAPRTMAEGGNNITDPHAWQDLKNGVVYADNIAAALASADPANAASYKSAGDAYVARLRSLDADVRKKIESVPPNKRRVITSHDAFGYFGAAYGVEFLAPEGLSTEAEASAGDLTRLIDQIRREGIRALFVENISDPRMIAMIASEAGVKPGGTLYSDALSPTDGPAPTYVAIFENNVPKLTAAMMDNE
jgi:zinc/manganese transport system substrate-binding protein